MGDPRLVTLANLAEGAAEELFQAALRDCLTNIDDPNTDWKGRRRITLTFNISTDEQRRSANIETAIATKLPGVKPVATIVFLGRHKGQLAAIEAPANGDLFAEQHGAPTAVVEGKAVNDAR